MFNYYNSFGKKNLFRERKKKNYETIGIQGSKEEDEMEGRARYTKERGREVGGLGEVEGTSQASPPTPHYCL